MKKTTVLSFVVILVISIISINVFNSVLAGADDYGIDKPTVYYYARDIVTFGNYWQEDTNGDGKSDDNDEKTPIRWQVLSRNGDELFLVSDMIIDKKAYYDEETDGNGMTWENSSIRAWLNNDFLNNAFTDQEKAGIRESNLSNPNNAMFGTAGGNDTTDKVFLLSIPEATSNGFSTENGAWDQARCIKVTKYAKDKGLFANDNDRGHWWLRSPGTSAGDAVAVMPPGNLLDQNNIKTELGVRPAIKIDASSVYDYYDDPGPEVIALKGASWDTVSFGSYGGSDLTWRVLDVNGDDAYIICDKIIDHMPFHSESVSVSWKNCTLRAWLNNEFYESAFSDAEKAMILKNETADNVSLPSLYDVSNEAYGFTWIYDCDAVTRVAVDIDSGMEDFWWTSASGQNESTAVEVFDYGNINCGGSDVTTAYGIRPTLHINLSSSAWSKGETITVGETDGMIAGKPTPAPKPTPTSDPDAVTTLPDAGTTITAPVTDPAAAQKTGKSAKLKTIKISSVKCKKNSKKITGKVSVKKATVKIKVGKKAYKKATVKGKKFTLKLSYKLKKKTKIIITAAKKNYKKVKKTYVIK